MSGNLFSVFIIYESLIEQGNRCAVVPCPYLYGMSLACEVLYTKLGVFTCVHQEPGFSSHKVGFFSDGVLY